MYCSTPDKCVFQDVYFCFLNKILSMLLSRSNYRVICLFTFPDYWLVEWVCKLECLYLQSVLSANTCVFLRYSLCRVCEHLCISTLFIMSCLRTLVYYYVVHYVVSANTCVLLHCSLCRFCEHLCITTLFITSYLRTFVYYYVVHYVVSANTCVLLRCSLCRVCEHLCISTLFIMSYLRTLVH